MTPKLITRTMLGIAAFLALAAAWWFLAPTQLGGKASYVTIKGTSMAPGLSEGDLAVVRAEPGYTVGDAVLYRSEQLRAPVLHRIVDVDGGAYVLRGDNRDVDDPETPDADRVVGRLWFSVPYAGRAIAVVHNPVYLALFSALIAFLVLAGGREVSKRRRHGAPRPVRADPPLERGAARLSSLSRTILTVGAVGTALFAGLALLAWTTAPTRERTASAGYTHAGAFSYSAEVPRSVVYPTGTVETGETAFTSIVRRLDVTFAYRLESRRPLEARGSIALDAVVSDGAGWKRTVPLVAEQPFGGATADVEGVLDLQQIGALTEEMRDLTGSTTSTFVVEVTPRVAVVGQAGPTAIREAFAPVLAFTLDSTALRVDGEDVESVLAPSQDGEVAESVPTRVGVEPLSLSTTDARSFAGLGLVVFLALTAGSAFLLWRTLDGSAPDRIAVRYAGRVVDAHAVIPEGRWISDVDSIESLVRIATLYDRVVLHVAEEGRHTYLVDDGIGVYRYRLGGYPGSAARVSPLPGAR